MLTESFTVVTVVGYPKLSTLLLLIGIQRQRFLTTFKINRHKETIHERISCII